MPFSRFPILTQMRIIRTNSEGYFLERSWSILVSIFRLQLVIFSLIVWNFIKYKKVH